MLNGVCTSINTTDRLNGLLTSNHRNVNTQRSRSNPSNKNVIESGNMDGTIVNEINVCYECRPTSEDPLRNADINPL